MISQTYLFVYLIPMKDAAPILDIQKSDGGSLPHRMAAILMTQEFLPLLSCLGHVLVFLKCCSFSKVSHKLCLQNTYLSTILACYVLPPSWKTQLAKN